MNTQTFSMESNLPVPLQQYSTSHLTAPVVGDTFLAMEPPNTSFQHSYPSDGSICNGLLDDLMYGNPPQEMDFDSWLCGSSGDSENNTLGSFMEGEPLTTGNIAQYDSYPDTHALSEPRGSGLLTRPPLYWTIDDCRSFIDLMGSEPAQQLHQKLNNIRGQAKLSDSYSGSPARNEATSAKQEKVLLYQFILAVLEHPKFVGMVAWIEPDLAIFYVICNRQLSALWGAYKGCRNMNWDKMSRGIRFRMPRLKAGKNNGVKRSFSEGDCIPCFPCHSKEDNEYIKFERVPHRYPKKKLVFKFKQVEVVKFRSDHTNGKYKNLFVWLDDWAAQNM